MPEPPKQGFLKGASSLLFGGGPKPTGKKKHVHFTKKIGPHIFILFPVPVHTPFILLLLLQIEMNSLGNMLAKRNQEWPKGQAEIWFRFKPMLPGEHPKCPKPKMQWLNEDKNSTKLKTKWRICRMRLKFMPKIVKLWKIITKIRNGTSFRKNFVYEIESIIQFHEKNGGEFCVCEWPKINRLFLKERKNQNILYISISYDIDCLKRKKLHIFWCLCYIIIIIYWTEAKHNNLGPWASPKIAQGYDVNFWNCAGKIWLFLVSHQAHHMPQISNIP